MKIIPCTLLTAFILGAFAAGHFAVSSSQAQAPAVPLPAANRWDADVEKVKSLLPDQSHAMSDVAQHFTNAWFAGHAKNWPLARFFVDETRSHLGWAVRLKPIRKNAAGAEFPLQPFADALTSGPLADLSAAIEKQDREAFEKSWTASLTACQACHVASDKPYLRLHVPTQPALDIIDFAPAAQ